MAISPQKLLALEIPKGEQRYAERDTMLYALGIGYGCDPLDQEALRYCYEDGLRAAPTLPLVLCHPGFWMRDLDTGIDWRRVVHGEQELALHDDLPVAGTVRSETRIVDVIDKGPGKAAIIIFERDLFNSRSGALIATMRQTNFCQGQGGFGGDNRETAPLLLTPERPADKVIDLPTRPETALLYRLSADSNPLHADPAAARIAGFDRPILHGLATFGIVAHSIVKGVCGYDGALLRNIAGRFTGIVYPGETIRTELWCDGDQILFRARVLERDVIVMNAGSAALRKSVTRC
jgi:acyl dehydratase